MTEFWKMMESAGPSQFMCLLVVAVTLYVVVCVAGEVVLRLYESTMKTIRVLFRGYEPPRPVEPEPEEPPDCEHDDNLTGKCIKPGGCKTTEECTETIEKHNEELKGKE